VCGFLKGKKKMREEWWWDEISIVHTRCHQKKESGFQGMEKKWKQPNNKTIYKKKTKNCSQEECKY
jgi:hypothetical protein